MKPHPFVSITESERQSGIPRHQCAECSRDYGDAVHCEAALSVIESNLPLVVIIEDCFIPERAGKIVELSRSTSTETNYAVITALAAYAELNLKRERLN